MAARAAATIAAPTFNAAWLADVASVEDALVRVPRRARVRARALELACGTGLFTRHLAPRVGHLTAVDASPEVIAINRARMAGGRPVDYVRGRPVRVDAAPRATTSCS